MVHRPGWYPAALTVFAHVRLEPYTLRFQTRGIHIEPLRVGVVAGREISDDFCFGNGFKKPLRTAGNGRRVALLLAGCSSSLSNSCHHLVYLYSGPVSLVAN